MRHEAECLFRSAAHDASADLEAVVAPEQLTVTKERGGAEDAARLSVRRLLAQLLLDVGLLDARKKPTGIKV